MKHYEELAGGEGRRVFYRAERFDAKTLMKSISPVVNVDNETFDLFDISMSGISFVSPENSSWLDEMNRDVPLKLKLGTTEIFIGNGKIRRIEPHENQHKIAIELTKGFLDIQKILEQHDDLALQHTISSGLSDHAHLVPGEYKQAIGDAVYMLRSARELLEKVEKDLGRNDSRGEDRIKDIVLACEEKALEQWREISKTCLKITQALDGDTLAIAATKRYTELLLTPELMAGASWNRAYMKPLGYPGDYQVMNYAYNLVLEGATAYEKFCHRLGTSTGEFIATRMTMTKQMIASLSSRASAKGQKSFNVASLGCGPAQEVANFLKSSPLPISINFTLIDQDHDALSYAYKSTYPEVSRLDGKASVKCLHATFLEFLATGKLFKKLDKQDLIYAVGLADYLGAKRGTKLVTDLYANLVPGGTLLIGCMRTSDESLSWQVEYVCDWTLVHRDEQEMLELTKELETNAKREVVVDSTGHCHLLIITKPE
ncbi:PilZ domain-containing protein [Sneathiella sp.]|uniref:PilZ domain-containing protein n=1 Tax=Sneathiella sp. TaxID=1964365 RepID=UPI0035696FE5